MSVKCEVKDCDTPIDGTKFTCAYHWFMLSKEMQEKLIDTFQHFDYATFDILAKDALAEIQRTEWERTRGY